MEAYCFEGGLNLKSRRYEVAEQTQIILMVGFVFVCGVLKSMFNYNREGFEGHRVGIVGRIRSKRQSKVLRIAPAEMFMIPILLPGVWTFGSIISQVSFCFLNTKVALWRDESFVVRNHIGKQQGKIRFQDLESRIRKPKATAEL